ncbi:MAG: flagellar assembly protein FliH [Alphaproteobacteria bacterium]|nr:flagellar assembly protein FliH [Alphaproteobacteria bacterium]
MPYRKYMFDLDFGQPPQQARQAKIEEEQAAAAAAAEEEIADEPAAPMFTEEELNMVREASFQEGREAGFAEAAEADARQIALAVTTLTERIDTVFRQQDEANDANARAAVRVAMAVLKKMLPAACEKHAFDEVARVVEDVVAHILDEPRIIVRVAAPLVEPVRERLEAAAEGQGFEGRVVVQADPRLAVGDARVEWTDGGAERDQARLLEEIEVTVERALAPPERRAAVEAAHDAEMGSV